YIVKKKKYDIIETDIYTIKIAYNGLYLIFPSKEAALKYYKECKKNNKWDCIILLQNVFQKYKLQVYKDYSKFFRKLAASNIYEFTKIPDLSLHIEDEKNVTLYDMQYGNF